MKITQFDMFLKQAQEVKIRHHPRYLEDKLQISCRYWFDLQYPQYRLLLHHSPNEGLLVNRKADGAKRKAMGVRAGFPDFILLLPNEEYAYLAIELKTEKGVQSKEQKTYQATVERFGGHYVIVRSIEQFKEVVDKYIANRKTLINFDEDGKA